MEDIKALEGFVSQKLNENDGLFVGASHRDTPFNKYLADILLALSKKEKIVIFAEFQEKSFTQFLPAFEMFKGNEKLKNYDGVHGILKGIIEDANASIEFLALLLTLHLSGLPIFCVDYLPVNSQEEAQRKHSHDVLYGAVPNITIKDLHEASAERVSKDPQIAGNIKKILGGYLPHQKYIVIGGPAHVQIAHSLNINALNIMPPNFYQNLLFGSHPSIIENLHPNNVISFTYEKDALTQVKWDTTPSDANKLKQLGFYASNANNIDAAEEFKNKGNAFFRKKDYPNALDMYDKAIKANSNYKEAWLNRGKTLRIMDRNEAALKSVQRALEIDPNYENAKSALKTIQAEIKRQQGNSKGMQKSGQ